jgi:predicted small metal-binding protein
MPRCALTAPPAGGIISCNATGWEEAMARKYIDCREFPSESNCSITIAADNADELVQAAVQHAVAVHKHEDTPELRNQIRGSVRDGVPLERISRNH